MTEQQKTRSGFWGLVARVAESPGLTMTAGVVLFLTAGWEVLEGIGEEFAPGAHHGIAVFGLVQVLAALPHCLHGIQQMHESHAHTDTHADAATETQTDKPTDTPPDSTTSP